MASVIFVEVLDRRGHVRRRERLDRFPATIGRAYSNDVILDDRFVGPEHLMVTSGEEGLALEDQGSVNGTFVYGSQNRVRHLTLNPGTEVRIGHTRLRFCTPDQAVAPATRTASSGLASVFSSTWASLGVIVTAVAVLLLADARETYQKIEAAGVLSTLAALVFGLLIWAGLWSLGNRLVSHEFRFLAHWAVASLALVAFTLAGTGFEYLNFFFSKIAFLEPAQWIVYGLLSLGMIYAHLSVASTMVRRRRVIAAALTVALLLGLGTLVNFAERDSFSGSPDFASELKPVGAGWVSARPAAEFFASTVSLEAELEALVVEDKAEEKDEE